MTGSRKMLDQWQAPEGAGKPIACLATSFTFEADFFEEDCLSRFLGLDSVRGESDSLAYVIEEEERLAEAGATALVDRSENPGNRNLRWDLLTVGVRGGLMHAKLSLLVWEHLVRLVVSSANLTRAGYRSQIEIALALDAFDGSEVPGPLFDDALAALRALVERAGGRGDEPGPKRRAQDNLDRAAALVGGFGLPARARSRDPRLGFVSVEPGRSAFESLGVVWNGGPPRWATVISPFFDTAEGENAAATALTDQMAQRGECQVDFVLPAEHLPARTVVRAPSALTGALPERIATSFNVIPSQDKGELRRLHAKAIILESERWIAVLVGSSNFTSAGLGLGRTGHLEANLTIGARADSDLGKALAELVPEVTPFDVDEVDWEPQEDEDESPGVQLPLGFVEALIEPGDPPTLLVRLDPAQLPERWSVELPVTGQRLVTSEEWQQRGREKEVRIRLAPGELPYWIQVRWQRDGGEENAGLPVNVTEMTKLPPPSELRELPVHLLLRVLGSTRPIHEALADEILREQRAHGVSLPPELDPLKRYSGTGQLLHRAKEASAALAGLQDRLERPVATLEALEWRLTGPLGPMAIADGLTREAGNGRMVEGEPAFLLAELALTLSRVDWERTGRIVGPDPVRERVRALLKELRKRRRSVDADERLERYLDRAFRKVRL